MHPFYPVFVKVLRPRFLGVVAEAVMTHPAMTLQGWDPMKRVKWLIRLVQTFLQTHGRVNPECAPRPPRHHLSPLTNCGVCHCASPCVVHEFVVRGGAH